MQHWSQVATDQVHKMSNLIHVLQCYFTCINGTSLYLVSAFQYTNTNNKINLVIMHYVIGNSNWTSLTFMLLY